MDADGYQTGMINSWVYYVKIVRANTMFYLKNSSGRLVRVSAPYVTEMDGKRYYPTNCGGAVLFPKLVNGAITSYTIHGGQAVLTIQHRVK